MNDRATRDLRPHPENALIFGDPEEHEQFDQIFASIKAHGILEPLAIKADGTILAGHLRWAAAKKLGLKSVPARVLGPMSYREELEFVVRSNTDRRHLTKGEIALAFKRLRETPVAQGGTKGKHGGDRKSSQILTEAEYAKRHPEQHRQNQGGASTTLKARDEAAKMLGVGVNEARALETVFTTPGVPKELKDAVNRGAVAPTPAAKAVATEVKRQGGAIRDQAPLRAVASPPPKAREEPTRNHAVRVAEEAQKYQRDYRSLFELYKSLDALLARRPLKSLVGPTEHHEYGSLVRDIALRAWREIEVVRGESTDVGRQMKLTVIDGGAGR